MAIVLGIDIGTSSIKCVAMDADAPQPIPPPPGWAGARGRGDTTGLPPHHDRATADNSGTAAAQPPPPGWAGARGRGDTECIPPAADYRVLAFAQRAYPTHQPREGWSEQDPEDYLSALEHVVGECVAECLRQGRTQQEIREVALSTQADTLIIADESGTPLRLAITWMDTRAEPEFREMIAEHGPDWWYGRLGQPLSVYSSACKLLWLRRHEPDMVGRRPRITYVPDFVAKRLTGIWATDIPSASWSPFYNPVERSPADQVLQALDVEPTQLSHPIPSGHPIGPVLPDMAARFGLAEGTMLIAGAFDQTAAALGAGALAGGAGVLSCGTAWVLYAVARRPPNDPKHSLCICCHVGPDEWGIVLPFTGGSAYDWLARVTQAAGQASDAAPLIFVPHLYGGLSPDWQSASSGSLLGLTLAHTPEDIRLALMRGMAFEARRNLEAAEPFAGKPEALRMVGGATRSDIWPQMIADVLGCVVEVAPVSEAACLGAAMLAAGRSSASAATPDAAFSPDPDSSRRMDSLYARYMEAYSMLCSHYAAETDA